METFAINTADVQKMHAVFEGIFYGFVTILLILSVIIEYFKLPIGGIPSMGPLAGRAIIAVLLLKFFPDIANLINIFTTELANKFGNADPFLDGLSKGFSRVKADFSVSFMGITESLRYLSVLFAYSILYITFYICKVLIILVWTLAYVFSPILIALFVHPKTAGATGALFRAIIEASSWKIVWQILISLFLSIGTTSTALFEGRLNIVELQAITILFGAALLGTPLVVRSLMTAGLSSLTSGPLTLGVAGVGFRAGKIGGYMKRATVKGRQLYNSARSKAASINKSRFPRVAKAAKAMPEFNVRKAKPLFRKPRPLRSRAKDSKSPEYQITEHKNLGTNTYHKKDPTSGMWVSVSKQEVENARKDKNADIKEIKK